MISHTKLVSALIVAAAVSACGSQPNLVTATGDTRPKPVIVQVPVEVTNPALEAGCWVQFYDERNFKGEMITLIGPAVLESVDKMSGKKVKRNIDSLVTGSKATLRVFEHAMFKDRTVAFGPNSREGGLLTKLGFGGEIQSMQLECTS